MLDDRYERDASERPWLRISGIYGPEIGVGDVEYRWARTEAQLNYVPVARPDERSWPFNRLEFHRGFVYFGMTGRATMLTPPIVPGPSEQERLD